MVKPRTVSAVPLRVRDACVVALEGLIPDLVALAEKEKDKASTLLSVFDKLGKYGLSGRKTVLAENPTVANICGQLVVEMFHPTEAQLEIFRERVGQALEALSGCDIEDAEDDGPDE
jgi:hypothetical protein